MQVVTELSDAVSNDFRNSVKNLFLTVTALECHDIRSAVHTTVSQVSNYSYKV